MIQPPTRTVFLGLSDRTCYPAATCGFSPSTDYPEYLFPGDLSPTTNDVYDLVRDGFLALGYDADNFGTSKWNPLASFIEPGANVLIKPNWVFHRNKNSENPEDLDCLLTHPSVVRAVVDYVLIALQGTGKLVIADAPMLGCEFDTLIERSGYRQLFEFLDSRHISYEYRDLRQVQASSRHGLPSTSILVNDDSQGLEVDSSQVSMHQSAAHRRYRVSDYAIAETTKYHRDNLHRYSVSRAALEADVIINIPKPKTHRLAGLTSARKNFVGITYDKASLPHRTVGAKSEGGDEYAARSRIKSLLTTLEELRIKSVAGDHRIGSGILYLLVSAIRLAISRIYSDGVIVGDWHANDTIWRTVSDLNVIVHFADKRGTIRDQRQRRVLNVADMIVSGQGNGPIAPRPKHVGIILISEDETSIDALTARIMGFDTTKVPGLCNALGEAESLLGGELPICSNSIQYDGLDFAEFDPPDAWRFDPYVTWRGHIESTDHR